MTTLWDIPAVVLAVLTWFGSPPTSLADAARHEAFRRQLMARSAVSYTNDTLPELRPSDIAPRPSAGAVDEAAVAAPDDDDNPPAKKPAEASTAEPVAGAAPATTTTTSGAGDEKTWRDRVAGLRSTLESDQVLAASLQSRVSALQTDFIARDDPAQRAAIGQDLAKTMAELDRMTLKIKADQAAIDKMKDDARRQGVPAAWVR